MMKDYSKMTHEELEKELAEIVKKNYEKGVVLLDRNYDICTLKIKKLSDLKDVEDIDSITTIIRAMKYKPDLKPYCKGMNDKTPLIHPITSKHAWKEKVYDDFVSREEFINRTGIFVTPQYFSYIYDMEWKEAKESGKSLDDFVDNYEDCELNGGIAEIPLHGTFKYVISDDNLSCLGDYEDDYDPNIWEIVNCLARCHEQEYDSKWEMIEKYKSILEDVMKNHKEAIKLLHEMKLINSEPIATIPS